MSHRSEWRPKIVVFACNYCSYTAADLAGTARYKMSPNFTIIRVMCSGRVDPLHILRALSLGADGVIVSGCHPGDCHYTSGNVQAKRRVDFLSEVLCHFHLNERLELHHISAAEGKKFQQVIDSFDAKLRMLGPTSVKPQKGLLSSEKRSALFSLMNHLAQSSKTGQSEQGRWIENSMLEGFGEPRFDPMACNGCGSCKANCPMGNIEFIDVGDKRTITYTSSLCIGCKTCVDTCPSQAIQLSQRLEVKSLLTGRRNQAVTLDLLRCERCDATIAPERQIRSLMEKTGQQTDAIPLLCDTCRRALHAERTVGYLRCSDQNILIHQFQTRDIAQINKE